MNTVPKKAANLTVRADLLENTGSGLSISHHKPPLTVPNTPTRQLVLVTRR